MNVKEELLKKCESLKLRVSITYLTSEYACEFIMISSKGVASFWTPIDIKWPVYRLDRIDNNTFNVIKEKISKNELTYEDIKGTSLEPLVSENIIELDSEDNYSSVFSMLSKLASISEEGFYCICGSFDEEGIVKENSKIDFYTDLDDCVHAFEQESNINYDLWDNMTVEMIEDYLKIYDEIDGFPLCVYND